MFQLERGGGRREEGGGRRGRRGGGREEEEEEEEEDEEEEEGGRPSPIINIVDCQVISIINIESAPTLSTLRVRRHYQLIN